MDTASSGRPEIVLGRDQTTELRMLVTAPATGNPDKSIPLVMRVSDAAHGDMASATDHFVAP
jgi:hypothetical protein